MTEIDADAALRLAALQGQSWIDEAVAGRIAAGADAAVAAVTEALANEPAGLAACSVGSFLATLEALAGVER
jgi:hypothetical protein